MPEARLARARAALPAGYQFPTTPRHVHAFNQYSGYCACGVQFAPHLKPFFPDGAVVRSGDGSRSTFIVTATDVPHTQSVDDIE
jgi:hypothetical protein